MQPEGALEPGGVAVPYRYYLRQNLVEILDNVPKANGVYKQGALAGLQTRKLLQKFFLAPLLLFLTLPIGLKFCTRSFESMTQVFHYLYLALNFFFRPTLLGSGSPAPLSVTYTAQHPPSAVTWLVSGKFRPCRRPRPVVDGPADVRSPSGRAAAAVVKRP